MADYDKMVSLRTVKMHFTYVEKEDGYHYDLAVPNLLSRDQMQVIVSTILQFKRAEWPELYNEISVSEWREDDG